MPINLLAIPVDHEHWNEGDATDSRSRPEMRFHAFHGQIFRQFLHHDDWGCDFVLEPSCGFGFNWLEHAGAIYGFMIQVVFPPGVIAVTLLSTASRILENRWDHENFVVEKMIEHSTPAHMLLVRALQAREALAEAIWPVPRCCKMLQVLHAQGRWTIDPCHTWASEL